MSLNASWLDNGLTAMYWRKYRAIFSSSPEGTVLIWWMYSDSRINSSHSWWPSLQGGNTPTHGVAQKKKKKRKSKIRPYLQKKGGYWVQNSQARRVRVFDPSRESVFSQETVSGWKQMLLLLRGALVSPRRMLWFHTVPLLHCTAGNVWSVIFLNLSQNSHAHQQNNPCSAWFKPLLASSQPPHPHQPPPIPILQRKGPHPNFGRRHQMVVVFVLFILSFSLSLCVSYLSIIQHSSKISLHVTI